MAILEESTKEFENKLSVTQTDEEKKVTEEKKTEDAKQDNFDFQNMAKELSDMDYEKMGFSKEEFEQANAMFAGMMQGMDGMAPPTAQEEEAAPPTDEESATAAAAPGAPGSAPPNPFAQGYQGLQGNLQTGPTGMPQLPDNIGEIVQDPEFQNFFQEFAS